MKNFYNLKITIFCLFVFSSNIELHSCNLSNYTLTSVSGSGPFTIVTRLCVGYGRTGSILGADANTQDILFGLYSSDPTFTVNSFLPLSITSARGFSNCTMDGILTGPLAFNPFNTQDGIYYQDPGIPPCITQPFACITSTALCGNVAQQCINFTFDTNVLPDSIRLFGVEGVGNPVAGCYPNSDMIIIFNGLLPVFWSTVNARKLNENEVAVNWTTLSEVNNYFFTVEKTDELVEVQNHHNEEEDLSVWTQCGIVNGTNKNSIANYTFIDKNPFPGLSYYRLKQTDYSGKFSYSAIVTANFNSESQEIKIYPNPSKNILNVEYGSFKRISLVNMLGEKVYEENVPDNNLSHAINTQNISEGIYLLKILRLNDELVSYKIKITH